MYNNALKTNGTGKMDTETVQYKKHAGSALYTMFKFKRIVLTREVKLVFPLSETVHLTTNQW